MNNKVALIIVDVQKGLFKLKQTVDHADELIGNIKKSISDARKKNIPIIYTQHENKSFLKNNYSDWEIVDEIKPVDNNDIVIFKKHPSLFKGTNLLLLLKERNINKLYITGLISNGCVQLACLEGLRENFEIVLITDAHSTFHKNAKQIITEVNDKLKSQGVILKNSSELW